MESLDKKELYVYMQNIYGDNAEFRDGQVEAILSVLSGRRSLVVQKTGWGKSLIYFLSTKILRSRGNGPTIIISPLLSLMNNQITSTQKFGLESATINHTNKEEWPIISEELINDRLDILFISPERLGNTEFMNEIINTFSKNIGMLVIDEAHCISDWGHDFRPDYKRISNIIRFMPPTVPILATTATANDRVVKDIRQQLGQDIHILKGSLARESLYIQVIHLRKREERLAWLKENIERLEGIGIIYCLTVKDCYSVSKWLQSNGIDAVTYVGKMDPCDRVNVENRFVRNEMKVLVATIAFGMGIDKPDIGFVIHFQKPGNIVAYYQQIGRAGRSIENAYAILFDGDEDDEISQYFINTAFPTAKEFEEIINILIDSNGLSLNAILAKCNLKRTRLENVLKFLLVNGDAYKESTAYYKTPKPWAPDFTVANEITNLRNEELEQMNTFIATNDTCYMEFITDALDDTSSKSCNHCGFCLPSKRIPEVVSEDSIFEALKYLKSGYLQIEPRKQWASLVKVNDKNKIPPESRFQVGYALSNYGDAGWGKLVSSGKYKDNHFSDELINASYDFLLDKLKEWDISWVTSIPSLRRPLLVQDFAKSLAAKLNLPYDNALIKKIAVEQKTLNNSYGQCTNALDSFELVRNHTGNVLLIDDMVDSRWTLTACSKRLIDGGVDKVYVFALANTGGSE